MTLHHETVLFSKTLRAASDHLEVKLEFVEKDYWLTLALANLARSKFAEMAVFKGGTSLSKGYNLIERFSEDVDIAILHDKAKTGNEIKTIIRTIEKDISVDLTELEIRGVTSKGSRFRKSVFEYLSIDKSNQNNKLIIEVNSFANPIPFLQLPIQSFVYDFLLHSKNIVFIDQYHLHPFEINVLSKEQTLIEKLVSLIRVSYSRNATESISTKIRHFYDLYFLMNDPLCEAFLSTTDFKKQFEQVLQDDRSLFTEPMGWQSKKLSESPLINDFENTWKQLKGKYHTELSALAYRSIPSEEKVAQKMKDLLILIG